MNINKIATYVYIDVSNIRSACLRSCGFKPDPEKLYHYFKSNYLDLRDVRYYEGIAKGDKEKWQYFQFLESKVGYTICTLERKQYIEPPRRREFACRRCGFKNSIEVSPTTVKLKSNVDVYLAADMVERVAKFSGPLHIILVSCDGDYAEAIRSMVRLNRQVFITILATPRTRKCNCLSSRLMSLRSELPNNVVLMNIENIAPQIT